MPQNTWKTASSESVTMNERVELLIARLVTWAEYQAAYNLATTHRREPYYVHARLRLATFLAVAQAYEDL